MFGPTDRMKARHVPHSPRSAAATVDEIRYLHLEAEKARAAAVAANDDRISADLYQLASHYDREARQLNLVAAAEQCSARF